MRGIEGREGKGRRNDGRDEGKGKGEGEGNPLVIHLKQLMVHPHHHHHPKEISQVPLFNGSEPL